MKISLFRFIPSQDPPTEMRAFNGWFHDELVTNPDAVPFEEFDITNGDLFGDPATHVAFAKRLYRIKKHLEKLYHWFMKR